MGCSPSKTKNKEQVPKVVAYTGRSSGSSPPDAHRILEQDQTSIIPPEELNKLTVQENEEYERTGAKSKTKTKIKKQDHLEDGEHDSETVGRTKTKIKKQNNFEEDETLSENETLSIPKPDCKEQNYLREIERENETLKDENAAWKMQYAEAFSELKESRREIHGLSMECDELKTRLSKMASDRLTDNNPNIADLSDENRAVKVGEKFSELYSNEWSDAFEDLTADDIRTEREAIKILADILKNVYEECKGEANRYIKDIEGAILKFTGNKEFSQSLSQSLKPYKDERKKRYKHTIPCLDKMMEVCVPRDTERTENVRIYVESATEICWLMCINDPPMSLCFDCKQQKRFNAQYFSPYTESGKFVAYLVWPAVLLHDDGPLVQKGVAQGRKSKKKKKNRKSLLDASPKKQDSTQLYEDANTLRKEGECLAEAQSDGP